MNLFIDVYELVPNPSEKKFLYCCNARDEDGCKEYFSDTLTYSDATPAVINDLIRNDVKAKFSAIHAGVIDTVILHGKFFA